MEKHKFFKNMRWNNKKIDREYIYTMDNYTNGKVRMRCYLRAYNVSLLLEIDTMAALNQHYNP